MSFVLVKHLKMCTHKIQVLFETSHNFSCTKKSYFYRRVSDLLSIFNITKYYKIFLHGKRDSILETFYTSKQMLQNSSSYLFTVGLQNNSNQSPTVSSILNVAQLQTKVIDLCETCLFKFGLFKVIFKPSHVIRAWQL